MLQIMFCLFVFCFLKALKDFKKYIVGDEYVCILTGYSVKKIRGVDVDIET